MKKIVSFILCGVLVLSSFPLIVLASENDIATADTYNDIIAEYDGGKKFVDSIAFYAEENVIEVDGVELPISSSGDSCPQIVDDSLMIPAEALCRYIDAEYTENKYGYDNISYEEREIYFTGGVGAYAVSEDGNDDVFVFDVLPYEENGQVMLPINEIADSLGYEIFQEDSKVLLTRPYQSCRLLVSTDKKNIDTLDAVNSIRDEKNDITIIQFETETQAIEAKEYYQGLKFVDSVEPDGIVSISDIDDDLNNDTVNDYAYLLTTEDDHFDSSASEWIGVDDMNDYLSEYENINDVVVAVVDTGICSTHEALQGRVVSAPVNYSDSGSENVSEDDHGHGTHVSGIIVSNTLDNVTVLCVKALNSSGNGTLYQVYEGMVYAVSQGAKVINLSLGKFGSSDLLTNYVKELWNNNITVCAAAGNSGWPAAAFTPAEIEECITVAAAETSSKSPYFTNYGRPVDIDAPGVNIYSTWIYTEDFDGYKTASGTSMSTPFVSAAAIMLYSYDYDYTAEYIHNRIRDNGQKGPGTDGVYYQQDTIDCRHLIDVDRAATPTPNISSGLYHDTLLIEFETTDEGARIYYTLDGTRASESNGILYTEPFEIDEITRVHAIAYCDGKYKSLETYFDYYLAMIADENDFTIDADGTITKYKKDSTYSAYVQIPDTIQNITVTAIGQNAFKGNDDLRILILPETCVKLANYAFDNCDSLSVIRGDGITSIGQYCFRYCESLFDVTLPKLSTIGKYSFYCCRKLQNFSNGYISEIPDHAFYGCRELECVELPSVTKVTTYGFYYCRSLEQIYLPNVISVGNYAFHLDDLNLEYVSFPNLKTLGTYVFENCYNLISVEFENFDGKIGDYAFNNCKKLDKATIPNATSIGTYSFYGCSKLSEVKFDNAETVKSGAFGGCRNLKSVSLNNAVTVNSVGSGYSSLYLPNCKTFGGTSSTNLQYLYLPNVTVITGNIAAENLKEAYLPKLESIGTSSTNVNLFKDCFRLIEIDLPLLTICYGYVYYLTDKSSENSLKAVNIPIIDSSSISSLFYNKNIDFVIGKLPIDNNNTDSDEESFDRLYVSSLNKFTVFADDKTIKATEIDGKYIVDIYVTHGSKVSAVADETDFEAWIGSNNRVKSTKSSYNFAIGADTELTIKTRQQGTASFYNANGDLIKSEVYSNFSDKDYPTAPEYYGHTFIGWSKTADEIDSAVKAGEFIDITAQYERNLKYYSVDVSGGTVIYTNSDFENGEDSYRELSLVTVKPTYEEMTPFRYWKDTNGNILSYMAEFSFYVSNDISIYAVYSRDEIIPKPITRISNAVIDDKSKKITFISQRELPSECTVISHGIIMTDDNSLDINTFIIGADGVLKGTSVKNGSSGTYTLYKSNVETGDTWYARSYVVYKTSNGKTKTIYSDIVSATMV